MTLPPEFRFGHEFYPMISSLPLIQHDLYLLHAAARVAQQNQWTFVDQYKDWRWVLSTIDRLVGSDRKNDSVIPMVERLLYLSVAAHLSGLGSLIPSYQTDDKESGLDYRAHLAATTVTLVNYPAIAMDTRIDASTTIAQGWIAGILRIIQSVPQKQTQWGNRDLSYILSHSYEKRLLCPEEFADIGLSLGFIRYLAYNPDIKHNSSRPHGTWVADIQRRAASYAPVQYDAALQIISVQNAQLAAFLQ